MITKTSIEKFVVVLRVIVATATVFTIVSAIRRRKYVLALANGFWVLGAGTHTVEYVRRQSEERVRSRRTVKPQGLWSELTELAKELEKTKK